ncbi:TonB-dependent receptor domain-containing protein [Salinibacter sp.]|uniref:TonB-dependent receptor domain-containing protein n=1 Tax=Salinibacter sp. TaxID=2065818 RepID=UPI0021E7DE85|nr:TonB-dependent receptor [Salinibacter sp.]
MKRLIPSVVFGLALLLLPGLAWAQQGTVTGTVTEAETGSPLPGATVQIVDEGSGAASDAEGQYRITGVPAGEQTLRVSFVGYQAQKRTVNVQAGGTVRVNFELKVASEELSEVVVTGLAQEQTQAEASVDVTSIDAAELTENGDFQSVEQLFQGSTPGVTVSKTSGNVGGTIRFNVRSGVSLNSDGQPVVYIDGTRIDNSEVTGFGAGGQGTSALADLDPNNIESIEVLKGPSATALYGTDGADGVVLITTKSGTGVADNTVEVGYSGTFGQSEVIEEYDSETFVNATGTNDLFRTADVREHSVSVSGRTDAVNYSATYTNRQNDGIIPNNTGERNNVQAQAEVNPTDEWQFGISSNFTTNEYSRPGNDNLLFGFITSSLLSSTEGGSLFGPLEDIRGFNDDFRIQRFTGSVSTSYSPEAVTGLQLQLSVGGDASSRRQDQLLPRGNSFSDESSGEKDIFTRENRQFNGDLNARYGYDITPNLSASSTVGLQLFTESTQTSNLSGIGFGSAAVTDIGTVETLDAIGEDVFNRRSGGVFGRQTFTYDETYSLNLSLRRDVSTQIRGGENSTFEAFYPGIRGNVRLAQFDFIPDYLTQFKVRAAFGQTGALPGVLDTQELRLGGAQSGFGTGGDIQSVGNPDLESETVSEITGGIDLGVNNRYSLSVTYYNTTTNNSIVNFAPAPSTGLGNFTVPRNVGEIAGQGVETGIDLTLLDRENARIQFGANYSYRYAEVKDLGGQSISGVFDRNFVREGSAPSVFFGLEVDGAEFTENGVYTGPNVIDQNGDGQITQGSDRTVLGDPTPDHFGGFDLNIQLFENLTLSGRAEYQLGHQVFFGSREFATSFGVNPTRNEASAVVFGEDGDAATGGTAQPGTPEYREAARTLASTNTADRFFGNFLEDADFLRLREVAVAYDFTGLAERLLDSGVPVVREFRVRLSGQNLLTVTDYSGPDPQVNFDGRSGQAITAGQDFFTLPSSRSFTAAISVGF